MISVAPRRGSGSAEQRPQVLVRPARAEDAVHLRQWRAEETVRRFQPLHDVPTSQLRTDIASLDMEDLYRGRGDRFVWIVEADGRPCGWITLVVANWEHGLTEIGYALSSAYQGRGVMTAALTQLLPDVFLRTAIERIEARCAEGNEPSQRVLEKLGFVREGTLRSYFKLRGERVDHHLYSLLRADYLGG
ncbi:MAG TPA: GNAT family protein [Thermoanaerobaculia bacterium]|nr:GNAT family protein [Thermoanaerobaculia bacterium]